MANFLTKAFITQSFGIPAPTLTEKNLPDQLGKVFIVTGGYAGVGKALTQILHSRNATVYVAGRSEAKAAEAIKSIQQDERNAQSKGHLHFLYVDYADLTTIAGAAQSFASRETRLDVLVNNAGVMFPPAGTKTKQGHDLQFGTNVLGPYLFTKLLMPRLVETAKTAPPSSVRVLWAASSGIQVLSPKGGLILGAGTAGPEILESQQANYGQTKVANVFMAKKIQELYGSSGIVSVSFNPGNLNTELQRHSTGILMKLSESMLHPPIFGAYTELYSGWSPDITKDVLYVMPWGRDGTSLIRKDIQRSIENQLHDRLWDWCEKETQSFA